MAGIWHRAIIFRGDAIHGYLNKLDMNEKVTAYIRRPNCIISQRHRVHFYVLLQMDENDFAKNVAIKEDR